MRRSVFRWLLSGAAFMCQETHFASGDAVHRRHNSRLVGSPPLSMEAVWLSHRAPPLVRTHHVHSYGGREIGDPTESEFGESLAVEELRQISLKAMSAMERFSVPNMTAGNITDDTSDAKDDNVTTGTLDDNATSENNPSNVTSPLENATDSAVGEAAVDSPVPVADGPLAAQEPLQPGKHAPMMDEPQRPAIGQSTPAGGNKSYGEYSNVVHYNIMCVASGLYLREDPAAENKFRLKCEKLDPDDLSFRFRFIEETDGRWRIRATSSHHYLWEYDVDNEVRGTESVADTFTSFSMEPQADWSYKMKVRANNHYLYQDSTTNILAGGDITDDYANFKLVALESAAACKAYQFQAVCPPNRCWWLKDHCEFTGSIRDGVTRGSRWTVVVIAFVASLGVA